MIPTFIDTLTGKTGKGRDASYWWWTEGNGGCDCNRGLIAFEIEPPCGCGRFMAVAAEGDLEGRSVKQAIRAMNEKADKHGRLVFGDQGAGTP